MKLRKDFPRYAEHPRCRKVIEKAEWYPLLFQWDGQIYWDGYHVMDSVGDSLLMRSAMNKQTRKMLQEGHWGKLDVTIDFIMWCRLFDGKYHNVIQLDLSNSTINQKGEHHES